MQRWAQVPLSVTKSVVRCSVDQRYNAYISGKKFNLTEQRLFSAWILPVTLKTPDTRALKTEERLKF
jgi:hypothetical protein